MDKFNNDIISKLKACLTRPLPGLEAQLRMAPAFRPKTIRIPSTPRAGVLILLYPQPKGLSTVFMKRPEYEGVHSGQISFPGGKEERSDPSIVHTALRETQEEIGVPIDSIDILGSLTPLYIPASEMQVYPAVGYAEQQPLFKTDPYEVEYLIEANLKDLFDPTIVKVKPYSSAQFTGDIPYFDIQGNHVWGATAMILSEFMEIIKDLILTE